jgi:small subunit ribosomal protein S1
VGDEGPVYVLKVDNETKKIALSVRRAQPERWEEIVSRYREGQVVPGQITKLAPFGAFVRVDEGIEGLVHISELAERHVEIPEQVVQVGDSIFVKVIDIDLERRRISLSLKQANEGAAAAAGEFDPSLYGMAAEYDEQGNYKYPEGFDPETNDWLPGYEKQREEWERQYAEAHARWEAHRKQIDDAAKAEAEARTEGGEAPTSYSSDPVVAEGTLASDEALAALREKLTGGY